MTTARAKKGNIVMIGIFDLFPNLSAAFGCVDLPCDGAEYTDNFLDVMIGSWLHRDNICWCTKGIPSRDCFLGVINVRWEIDTRGF